MSVLASLPDRTGSFYSAAARRGGTRGAEGWGVRLLDLILAMVVFAMLLFIARHQFPSYAGMSYEPAPQAASPSPAPTS